jgi:hypothetical protein
MKLYFAEKKRKQQLQQQQQSMMQYAQVSPRQQTLPSQSLPSTNSTPYLPPNLQALPQQQQPFLSNHNYNSLPVNPSFQQQQSLFSSNIQVPQTAPITQQTMLLQGQQKMAPQQSFPAQPPPQQPMLTKSKQPLLPPQGCSNDGYDDADGNYMVQIGEELEGRFLVQEVLGRGSFGVVAKCVDLQTNEPVAVKIIKNRYQFYQQAKIEIGILKDLNDKDQENRYNIGKFISYIYYLCLS